MLTINEFKATRIISILIMLLEPEFSMADTTPFHQQYPSLDTPESRAFIKEALSSATSLLGPPKTPIREVYLRLSTPISQKENLKKNFQLTEFVDRSQGIFAIYVSRAESDYSFHGQLAHEVGHLIDADMCDAYIEGANTVFAELFLRKKGFDWSGWARYFEDGNEQFYGSTYEMMKAVIAVVGSEGIRTLLLHSKWDPNRTKKYIDIDSWILSLPSDTRQQVVDVIKRHSSKVKQAIAAINHPAIFVLPQ